MLKTWNLVLLAIVLAVALKIVEGDFEIPELPRCRYENEYYDVGRVFYPHPCTTCICQEAGDAFCETMDCGDLPLCNNGQQAYIPYGMCCPKCPPDEEETTTTPGPEDEGEGGEGEGEGGESA